jgi:hypothetical protein
MTESKKCVSVHIACGKMSLARLYGYLVATPFFASVLVRKELIVRQSGIVPSCFGGEIGHWLVCMTYPAQILEEAEHPWALEISSASHIEDGEKRIKIVMWLNRKLRDYTRSPLLHRDRTERSMRRIVYRTIGFDRLNLTDATKEVLEYGGRTRQ